MGVMESRDRLKCSDVFGEKAKDSGLLSCCFGCLKMG